MKRVDFIKKSLSSISMLAAVPTLDECNKAKTDFDPNVSNPILADPTVTPSSCVATNSETAGPFPTKDPSDFITQNIVSDRKGKPTTLKIYIRNVNNGCEIIKNAIVDIWHCDADGEYSEYGNSASAHFLRGRQNTNANGVVAWNTVFPGWYIGRAPHIHVKIFNSSGKSLLTTQIAFPKAECDKIYKQCVYLKKGLQDTTN